MTFKVGDRVKVRPELRLTNNDTKRGFAHGKILEIIRVTDLGRLAFKGMEEFGPFSTASFIRIEDDMFSLDAIDE